MKVASSCNGFRRLVAVYARREVVVCQYRGKHSIVSMPTSWPLCQYCTLHVALPSHLEAVQYLRRDVSTGHRVASAHTLKSNTRNCITGTNCTENAASCIGFRGVGSYQGLNRDHPIGSDFAW
eukprot:790515-Rhodomonas_salina.3